MPWNGTAYEHNYQPHGTDIAGYSYCTEEWCPRCTMTLMGASSFGTDPETQEAEIREYGRTIRDLADPEDPRWKDSDTIPQPIFRSDDLADEDGTPRRCAGCREDLAEC